MGPLGVWSGKPSALDSIYRATASGSAINHLAAERRRYVLTWSVPNDEGPRNGAPRCLERETRFELATSTLARLRSTN